MKIFCLFILVKKLKITTMRKGFFIAFLLCLFSSSGFAANGYVPKQFSNTSTGDGLYPYSLNNRRQDMIGTPKNNIPGIGGTSPMQSTGKRGVIKRPTKARASTTNSIPMQYNNANNRRVVPRSGSARSAINTNNYKNNSGNRGVTSRSAKQQNNYYVRTSNTRRESVPQTTYSGTKVSSQKCFANYKECMETYCRREDMPYNRCYCSARLAQIDSKYQNKIDDLIKQIIVLQNTTTTESDEDLPPLRDFWEANISKYTGSNAWDNLEDALKIDWPDQETRFQGQNAFNIGHQYCVNYLRACSYMASNLRDAYKSEIARDCATYEESLQGIKTVAESVIENYKK